MKRARETALATIRGHVHRAHRPSQRLSPALQVPLPRLLLAGPSGGAGADLRPRHRRADRLVIDAGRAAARSPSWRSPGWASGPFPSTGSTARSSTGSPTTRSAPGCTSSSTASITTTRTTRCGSSCPRARASRSRCSSPASSGSSSGFRPAFPLFAGFLVGYLMYDYTHYYLHHAVPKTDVRQAPARAAHAPSLPGPPLRIRRLDAHLGRRLRHASSQAQLSPHYLLFCDTCVT